MLSYGSVGALRRRYCLDVQNRSVTAVQEDVISCVPQIITRRSLFTCYGGVFTHIERCFPWLVMRQTAMRQMMGKDAASAFYFLLVKNGNSATSLLTENTFPPSQVINLQWATLSWSHRCMKTQKISAGLLGTCYVLTRIHDSFTATHKSMVASRWNWTFLLLGCQRSYSNSWTFPWPLCNTGNVDLCSLDSRVKHFLHSSGSPATHAVLSVTPQLFRSEQKCLEERGRDADRGQIDDPSEPVKPPFRPISALTACGPLTC